MTAAAIYETGPVCEAGDTSVPTDKGAAVETGEFCETSGNLKSKWP